jgi:hypothetical protein
MPDEPEITEPVSPYPIDVELADGTYTLLDPEGEPSGPRVRLPSGAVTALNAHGGALDGLSVDDMDKLTLAVPEE